MPEAEVNDITIAYETIGSENDRPLLLIAGLTSQMVTWPDEFCRRLVAAGHFVIRFDNRDCGLSSKIESGGVPDVEALMADARAGKPVEAPYSLSDMAADAVGLLAILGLDRAHVCGLSMGGMIAQLMAVEYPDRVASLISMMSTTGRPGLPGPTPEATQAMLSMPPVERGAYVRYLTGVYRAFAGESQAFDAKLSDAVARDELALAVASHATSKITEMDDLFRVGTLGFRGEALASIAEVSQLRLRSRPATSDAGMELEVNGGHIGELAPCGCPVGTAIEIRNLFFNTPVRRKFLRTAQTEMGHCTEAFTRIALAHENVHFTLRHGDRQRDMMHAEAESVASGRQSSAPHNINA